MSTAEDSRKGNQKKRRIIQAIKDVPCMDCGQSFPPYVMDFDHRDPANKLLNIAKVSHHGLQRLLDEIEKCDIVCANCHRIRTHGRSQPAPLAERHTLSA